MSMDLEAEILSEHSKSNTVRIAKWIRSDRRRFNQLMDLFLHGDYLVTQRSAWIVGQCYEQDPGLINPWLPAMLARMQEPDVHVAVKRNVVRILQCADIPKALLGTIVSLCFDYVNSYDTPIAVKAYSMTVLVNAAERETTLRRELKATIELQLRSPIPAVTARARRVMKKLQKMDRHAPVSSRRKDVS